MWPLGKPEGLAVCISKDAREQVFHSLSRPSATLASQGFRESPLLMGSRQSARRLDHAGDQRRAFFRRFIRQDAMSEIENMARSWSRSVEDGASFGFNRRRRRGQD